MPGIATRDAEKSFWIPSSGQSVFVCHHPASPAPDPRGVFVMCPPFGEEKNKSQRLYVELARALADRGNAVYRFDYSGTADSSGTFETATLPDWRQNLADVIRLARAENPGCALGLAGLRFGCALTALAGDDLLGAQWLVHIAPAVDVPRFLNRTLREKLVKELLTDGRVRSSRREIERNTSAPVVDLDGFPLSQGLKQDLMGLDVLGAAGAFTKDVLIVHSSRNPRLTADENELCEHYSAAGARVTIAEVSAEPYWSVHGIPSFDDIVRKIVDWIGRQQQTPPRSGGSSDGAAPRRLARQGTEIVADAGEGDARLSAVVHVPDGWKERDGTAVVMVHGWAGYRIGPHQMLVSAAREFCRQGFLVVRVDVRGRGNSGGRVGDASVETLREDAGSALRHVRAQHHPARTVMLGQCVGGHAVLGVEDADGFVVWSAPPVDQRLPAKFRKMRFMLGQYLAKARKGETWKKLVRGELKGALIREAVVGHFRPDAMPAGSGVQPRPGPRLSGKPCLMIYGGQDPDAKPARKALGEFCRRAGLAAEFRIIAGANHSFYSLVWEREVVDSTADWLTRHFRQRST